MRVDNPSSDRMTEYFATLDLRVSRCKDAETFERTYFLDLGTNVVRVIACSQKFARHIEQQLTFVLRDSADHYDATMVVWQDTQIDSLASELISKPKQQNPLRDRVYKLAGRELPKPEEVVDSHLLVFDYTISTLRPVIEINPWAKIVQAWNSATNTHYYAVENLEPEEFIKQGHIFVQALNKILKSPTSGLVHGAAIGLEKKGILFCARGQRGKSTLAVRAMLDGFEYVSDDYLVLGKDDSGLYAWPIYSIITLSAMMYGDLYPNLNVKFVSNNARKDKYVFNIENYHERFEVHYPIKLCMFPQIVSDPDPSIVECNNAGKGRAIVELVHSTISQMGDNHDIGTIKKLMSFVNDLPFYQINICRDIDKNLQCLRKFLKDGVCGKQKNVSGMLHSRAIPPKTIY